MAIKQRPDGRWVVYYRARDGSGKTIYESFGRTAADHAAAVKRNNELGLRRYEHEETIIGILFWQIAEVYVKSKRFRPNPKKHLIIRLGKNILPYFGNMCAADITDAHMDKYVTRRVAQGVKYSTISRELSDVKAILNWGASRKPPLIFRNPVRDYKKPESDDEIIIPPTSSEIQKILAAASEHIKRVILISYYTGLRPGAVELLSLKWENVNFDNQTIQIHSAHKGGPVRRTVDLHPVFLEALTAWYQKDKRKKKKIDLTGLPIIHYHGKEIQKIGKAWKGTLKRAGITRRIRPYDLRHDFVTRALENGADIKTVSEITGSAPATLMRHYQHVSNPQRKKTVLNQNHLVEIDRPHTRPYNKCKSTKKRDKDSE